jgi:hypothetical protein
MEMDWEWPTEAILLLCNINAEEERDVDVIDIPNVFIQMQVEDEEDMAIIKICEHPRSDCSRCLQVLCHN